ncbi:MAG: DUF2804 domain-containing protein [Nevskiaceae bacterium]|nr:MAG: DUF2804 domain-containing protein [Nevskiaceae bacterium]TBR73467.1 MAG: DUF2804 domain-containing protein [Nevskiaceae bacterium]
MSASTLVDPHGRVACNRFAHTLGRVNGREARYLTPFGKLASRFARHFHYKQFQFFGIVAPRLMLGCAFADTAWLGLAFLYVYDLDTGELREWTWRSPLARALHLSDSPRAGTSTFRRGAVDIAMHYRETPAGLEKHIAVDTPDVELDATLTEGAFQPMSICTRTGVNGFTYTNKLAGVPVAGTVRIGGHALDLAAIGCLGHHDFSAGYMRRETYWNWVCTSTRVDGHTLGINLSCGTNETSFSENCLWLDGRLIPVAGAQFDYDRENLMAPWHIHDATGAVDLRFTPAAEHREVLNVAVFASNFHQLFGIFDGRVCADGTVLALAGIPGFVEEQYAKW